MHEIHTAQHAPRSSSSPCWPCGFNTRWTFLVLDFCFMLMKNAAFTSGFCAWSGMRSMNFNSPYIQGILRKTQLTTCKLNLWRIKQYAIIYQGVQKTQMANGGANGYRFQRYRTFSIRQPGDGYGMFVFFCLGLLDFLTTACRGLTGVDGGI